MIRLFPAALLLSVSCTHAPAPEIFSSVAVLPFGSSYVGSALTVEVSNSLCFLPDLQVLAPSTAFRAAKPETLPADVLLLGALEEKEGLYRLTLRLTRAASGAELHRETLERGPAELIRFPQDIARTAAAWLNRPAPPEPVKSDTADFEAHLSYLHGLHESNHPNGSLAKAISYYQGAIDIDEYFAAATARLAEALLRQAKSGPAPALLQKLRATAKRAAELNPNSAIALSVYAEALTLFDWRHSEASLRFRDALRIQPSLVPAHLAYAALLIQTRHSEEAASHIAKASQLDPLGPDTPNQTMWLRLQARQISSEDQSTHWIAAYSESLAGNHAKAVELLEDKLPPTPVSQLYAASVYRNAGRLDRARQILRSLRLASPVTGAAAAALLDDRDAAFRLLQEAVATRDPQVLWVQTLPMFDSLKTDPRFEKIAAQLSLT